MPTPSGLPKVGEIWERRIPLDWKDRNSPITTVRFKVLQRGSGTLWSLRVKVISDDHPQYPSQPGREVLWVDAYYFAHVNQLHYIPKEG